MGAGVIATEGPCVMMFLFILFAVLAFKVKADVRKLDMAPNAVDDVFSHCRDKMLKAVTEPGGLLEKELAAGKEFKELWSKNRGTCKKNIPGGTSYHVDALEAYSNSMSKFRKTFNDLVYSKGRNRTTYNDEFPFKSLHFLLTDSLRLLNRTRTCKTVFYGTMNTYTADKGTEVRFGKFLKVGLKPSSEIEVVETENDGTLFNITSCAVLNVEENTCRSEELQHLISPAEVFTVKNITLVSNEDVTYKLITLTHSRFHSNHNCSFFLRSGLPPADSFRVLVAVMSYILASLLLAFLL